jgi:hypothetical protein
VSWILFAAPEAGFLGCHLVSQLVKKVVIAAQSIGKPIVASGYEHIREYAGF